MSGLKIYIVMFVIMAGQGYSLIAQKMVASKPVVSLWRTQCQGKVSHALPFLSTDLPLHDTQILYGERLELLEDPKNGWLRIKALEQPVFDVNTLEWRPIEGWVQAEDVFFTHDVGTYNLVVTSQWATLLDSPRNRGEEVLSVSFGTMLTGSARLKREDPWWQVTLPTGLPAFIACSDVDKVDMPFLNVDVVRKKLVAMAKTFLGSPYCAGGRSAWDKSGKLSITSVDCSGLISLVYKSCGLYVPRYAHYQWLRAVPVKPQDLAAGDLVFVKYPKDNFSKVRHVMMYIGEGLLLEATGLPSVCTKTRIVSFQDKFGISFESARNGQRTGNSDSGRVVGEREIYCGSFLSGPDIIKQLPRDLFDQQPTLRSVGQYLVGDEVNGDESEYTQ